MRKFAEALVLVCLVLPRSAFGACDPLHLTASGTPKRGGTVTASWCIPQQYLTATSYIIIVKNGDPLYSQNAAGWKRLSANGALPPESGSITIDIYSHVEVGMYQLRLFHKENDTTLLAVSSAFEVKDNAALCPDKIKPFTNPVRVGMDHVRFDYCSLFPAGSYPSGWFALYKDGETNKNNYEAWVSLPVNAERDGQVLLSTNSSWVTTGKHYLQYYEDGTTNKPGAKSALFDILPPASMDAVTLTASISGSGISAAYNAGSLALQSPTLFLIPSGGDIYSAVQTKGVSAASGSVTFALPPTGSYFVRFIPNFNKSNHYKDTTALTVDNDAPLITLTATASATGITASFTVPSQVQTQSPQLKLWPYGGTSGTPLQTRSAGAGTGSVNFDFPASTGTYTIRYYPKSSSGGYRETNVSVVSPNDVAISGTASGLTATISYTLPQGLVTSSPKVKIYEASTTSLTSPVATQNAAGSGTNTLTFTLPSAGSYVARYFPSGNSTEPNKSSAAFSVTSGGGSPGGGGANVSEVTLTVSVGTQVSVSYVVPSALEVQSPQIAIFASGGSVALAANPASGTSGSVSFPKPSPGTYFARYYPKSAVTTAYKDSSGFTIASDPPPPSITCPVSLYVSANGTSSNAGTDASPLDVYTARDRAVAILNDPAKACHVSLLFKGGNYFLAKPIYIPPWRRPARTQR